MKNFFFAKCLLWSSMFVSTPFFVFSVQGQGIVITEVMRNPAAVSDSKGEWLELYNPAAFPVDINGWSISDNGSNSHIIDNGMSLMIPAGKFLVLGLNKNMTENGGVQVEYDYGSSGNFALGNGADEVILRSADGTMVDSIAWDGGAEWPDPDGASMALKGLQLDNNSGSNWCVAVDSYGNGDYGSPGLENRCEDETITGMDPNIGSAVCIYPNPGKGIFKIMSSKKVLSVRTTDLSGKMLYSKKFSGGEELKINLSDLPAGLFLLQLKTAEGYEVHKVRKY